MLLMENDILVFFALGQTSQTYSLLKLTIGQVFEKCSKHPREG